MAVYHLNSHYQHHNPLHIISYSINSGCNSTHVLEVNYICIKSKKNNQIIMNQLKLLLLLS
jgi:hypothetical protein